MDEISVFAFKTFKGLGNIIKHWGMIWEGGSRFSRFHVFSTFGNFVLVVLSPTGNIISATI